MTTREARDPAPRPRPGRGPIPLALLTGVVLAGCGNLTAGGADATVSVSGEAPEALAQVGRQRPELLVPGPLVASEDGAEEEPEGEVEVEFRLFLVGREGTVVALSDDDIRVRVDVRGRQEAEVVRETVPAIRYDELRIVFSDIEVEVESGLVVDGVPIVGEVRVELEGGPVTVSRPLDLDVPEGGRVELLIDLNTDTWLRTVDPDLRRVAEEIFATAVTVVVR
jgi:hypothetical protein